MVLVCVCVCGVPVLLWPRYTSGPRRISPRQKMLIDLYSALGSYNLSHGAYPPDWSPPQSCGQILYEYLCRPLPPSGDKFLDPYPQCVYVRPDGTKELRGPLGHRYIYRLIPNAKTGVLQPVVEEVEPHRPPRK